MTDRIWNRDALIEVVEIESSALRHRVGSQRRLAERHLDSSEMLGINTVSCQAGQVSTVQFPTEDAACTEILPQLTAKADG
jgi:hypothetical protein